MEKPTKEQLQEMKELRELCEEQGITFLELAKLLVEFKKTSK